MTAARTILDATFTDVTAYTSDILNVGDILNLLIDVQIDTASGGTASGDVDSGYRRVYQFSLMRLNAFDLAIEVAQIGYVTQADSDPNVAALAGLNSLPLTEGIGGIAFGDRIQVHLLNPGGISVTGKISIIGKG